MKFKTIRPSIFKIKSNISKISAILPPVPPTSATSRRGRFFKHSGASAFTTVMLLREKFSAFCIIKSAATVFLSIAITCPCVAMSAASIDREPVPAPMSATKSCTPIFAFAKVKIRISLFVIGTLPRINFSSSIPNIFSPPEVKSKCNS